MGRRLLNNLKRAVQRIPKALEATRSPGHAGLLQKMPVVVSISPRLVRRRVERASAPPDAPLLIPT
jgi:hypothetical protein